MKLGIRGHDLGPKGSVDDLIESCKRQGFSRLQLVFKKSFVDYPAFNEESAKIVSKKLEDAGIQVAMLGAYFNPVHSNKELVKANVALFKEHLKYAHLFHCPYVGTETGSYNDDKWTYNPKNQTEEGYQETMKVFKDLVATAELYGSTVLMEPAYGHVIYSVKQCKRAYDELHSEHLKVTIDIYNLLYNGNYSQYKEIFHEAMETFGENIKIIHLKDFYVEDSKLVQCGLGKGIIDFTYIIKEAKAHCPNATLVFEGVTGEDIAPSKALVEALL